MARMPIAEARGLGERALAAIGYSAEEAALIADHLIDNELRGLGYGGLPRALSIADRLTQTNQPREPIRVEPKTAVSALVHGGNNVGYLVADIDWDGRLFLLHHMRIQNHLRKMGLARQALAMIVAAPPKGWGMTIDVPAPAHRPAESEGVAMDEALPTPDAIRRVKRIIQSVPGATMLDVTRPNTGTGA